MEEVSPTIKKQYNMFIHPKLKYYLGFKDSLVKEKMKERKTFEKLKDTTKKFVRKVDVERNVVEQVKDEVATETSIQFCIDDKPCFFLNCSPTKIREMATGYLLSQGVIKSLKEIRQLQVLRGKVCVEVKHNFEDNPQTCRDNGVKKTLDLLAPETVLNVAQELNMRSIVYKKTGGTHAAALLNITGEFLVFSEDISRYNAVDKVIGEAALKHINLRNKMLAITGRVSSEIVMKAANVGISVIISISAPTDKGVEVAKKKGITLVGFTRDRRFNIYAHSEIIEKVFS